MDVRPRWRVAQISSPPSRRQTLDAKPTNMNQPVHDLEELVRRPVGPAIHLDMVGLAGLRPALIDPGQSVNAPLNLYIDAPNARSDGGRIIIETANRLNDEAAGRQYVFPPGRYLSLCVSDIPARQRAR